MARNTRQQRRRNRRKQEAAAAEPQQGVAQRARARQQQVRPASQPAKQQTGRRERPQRGRFVRESWGELKKVEWPNQQQLISGTAVVIAACLITGAYLYLNDQVWQYVVKHLFLQ